MATRLWPRKGRKCNINLAYNTPKPTLTAARWSVYVCMGVVVALLHTNSLLSFPPLARYWLSGDHLRPHTCKQPVFRTIFLKPRPDTNLLSVSYQSPLRSNARCPDIPLQYQSIPAATAQHVSTPGQGGGSSLEWRRAEQWQQG